MHTACIQIVAASFRQPPLAFFAVSPAARLSAERSEEGYKLKTLRVTVRSHSDGTQCIDTATPKRVVSVESVEDFEMLKMMSWWFLDPALAMFSMHVDAKLDGCLTRPIAEWEGLAYLHAVLEHFYFRTQSWKKPLSLEWIGSCVLLRRLWLRGGVSDFSPLLNLRNLEELIISDNTIDDYKWIDGCEQLRTLRIYTCRNKSSMYPIVEAPACRHLTEIAVRNTRLSNLEWLRTCSNLNTLRLDYCENVEHESFSEISHLRDLQVLSLRGTRVDSMEWLSQLPGVEVLDLGWCSEILDFSFLTLMPQLQDLNLAETNVESLEWAHRCQQLITLDLQGCKYITDCGPLASLGKLKTLSLSDTKTQDFASVTQCPALEALYLNDCKHAADYSALAMLQGGIRVLSLAEAKILNVDWITACASLETLDLSGCVQISDFSPLGTNLRNLRELNLSKTRVSRIDWLTGCAALQVLNIRECALLDGDCFAVLGACPLLADVDVSSTKVPSLDWALAAKGSLCSGSLRRIAMDFCWGVTEFRPLTLLPRLESVSLIACRLKQAAWIVDCRALTSADLTECYAVTDTEALCCLPSGVVTLPLRV